MSRTAPIIKLDAFAEREADKIQERLHGRAEHMPRDERAQQRRQLVDDHRQGVLLDRIVQTIVDGNHGEGWYAHLWRQYNRRAETYIETGKAVDFMFLARQAYLLYALAEYNLPTGHSVKALEEIFGSRASPDLAAFDSEIAIRIRERAGEYGEMAIQSSESQGLR